MKNKYVFLFLNLCFSTLLFAEPIKINCDQDQGLKAITAENNSFQYRLESATERNARLNNEQAQIKLKCQTAIQCLNHLKLSQPDQKSISQINQLLQFYASVKENKNGNAKELEYETSRLNAQIKACEISELVLPKQVIEIKSNSAGLNKNKNGFYESEPFERVIETSLREGVDPFLALSILLLENPPTVGSNQADSYRRNFGTLPVDSIAAYDILGCYSAPAKDLQIKNPQDLKRLASLSYNNMLTESEKYENPEMAFAEIECEQYKKTKSRCSAFMTGQKNIPQFDITSAQGTSQASEKTRMCSKDLMAAAGKFPNFSPINEQRAANNCCVDLTSNFSEVDSQQEFLGLLGVKYLKKNVQDCVTKFPLTYCVQKYNGLGCFNCTKNAEQMKNECLSGMVMEDRPVYGARAMDLMVNALMTNKNVNALILKISQRTKNKVISVLCFNKLGEFKINSDQFEKEQKEYLFNGQAHAYKFSESTAKGNQFIKDLNSQKYQTAEIHRSKVCAKYFK